MTYASIISDIACNACDLHRFTPPSPIISLPFWYSINFTPTPSNRQPRLGPTQRLSTPPRNITLLPQNPQDPDTLLPPPQPLLQLLPRPIDLQQLINLAHPIIRRL